MRLNFTVAVLAIGALAIVLLVYVFGATPILKGFAWAALGAVLGWVGSLIVRSDTQSDILLDILAGAAGAVCGLLLYSGGSLTEGGPVERILSAILGSVVLIAAAALIRLTRSRAR